jgi:hypothetical protein
MLNSAVYSFTQIAGRWIDVINARQLIQALIRKLNPNNDILISDFVPQAEI